MRHFLHASALLLASAIVTRPETAQAEENKTPAVPQVPADAPSAMFGAKSELVLSNDSGLEISNTNLTGGGGNTFVLQFRPAIDYFVIDNLSVGAFLGVNYVHVPTGHTTSFSFGGRVGYNVPVAKAFSIWPKLGLSYAGLSQGGGNDTSSSSSLALNLFVPIQFHPVEHFFIGFGPALDVDMTGDNKATVIAGRLTFGGWMLL
jgi:hypothetical protein